MKNKQPLLPLLFLLILLMGAGYLFSMTEKKMVAVNRLRSEVNLLSGNQVRLDELSQVLSNISGDVDTWNKTLPISEANVATFAATMESAARSQGLVIVWHFGDFPEIVDIGGHKMYGLATDIILEGSFQGVRQFTAVFSKLPYFYRTDKLTLIGTETKKGVKATFSGMLMMGGL